MSLEVKVEEINIFEIIENSDLSSENKKLILKSGILLLPATFPTSHERGNFSSETPDFIKYIRINHPEIKISLFENPGEEKVQGLHAADIIIPPIFLLIQAVSYDVILNIIASYLYDKLKGDPDIKNTIVKADIYYEETPSSVIKRIKYEGPVSGLKDVENIASSNEKK